MVVPMAKVVFTTDFHWGRPKSNLGFGAKASDVAQTFPRDFIDAAIKAGAAHKPPPANKTKKTQRS